MLRHDNKERLLDDKPTEKTVCGIQLKKSYSSKNLLAIFYVWFMVFICYTYTNI